ncbi:MAG: hypothetical protein KAJ10_00880, partial [Thermodesulfovibrionia bacterium]|nr:hypothetical protein [Thermodesulfovibrionia bacterium]
AIYDYNKAIDIDPKLAKPYDNRGAAFLVIGEAERACSDFIKACELGECSTYDLVKSKGYCDLNFYAFAVQ